jgi:hypothetical protein
MSRRALRKKSRSESIRQSFGVVAVGALLGTGLFAIADYFTAQHWVRPAPAATRNAAEIYTGSVLYMPQEGRNCRQMLFDNQTGRVTDNGSVDCENAAYRGVDGNVPKQWSSARARVIANGFRQH